MHMRNVAFAALALLVSTVLHAQGPAWPSKPIRWIIPYPPGGITDGATRLVVQKVAEQTGWTIVVENKPGANSILGADIVAKATPDGYTFLTVIAAHAANATLYAGKLPFDAVKSFAPVSLVGIAPLIMTSNNDLPAKDIKGLIADARANPGRISYGSSGVGAAAHLTTELFNQTAGVQMVHVPYKGSAPMVTDLIAGQVDASMDAATSSWPHVQTGKLRPLGVSTKERAFFAPELPPIAQFVPGFDVKPWHGVMAPARTPQPIIDKLSSEIQAFVKDPATQQKLKDRGVVPVGSTAQEFAKVMNDEYELYRQVVRDAGIKPE